MDRYQVELTAFPGDDETRFVAALRIVGEISLADAVRVYRHAVNRTRTVLVAGVSRDVAGHIAASFSRADIAVTVQPSSVRSPMICRPQADALYRFNAARMIVPVSPTKDHADASTDES